MTKNLLREGECFQCGKCCRELKIKINYRIDGEVAQYYKARGVDVQWRCKYTILTIPNYPCPHLRTCGKCRIYDTEALPRICMDYPQRKWQLVDGCGFYLEEDK
jgi:hypothetical protein